MIIFAQNICLFLLVSLEFLKTPRLEHLMVDSIAIIPIIFSENYEKIFSGALALLCYCEQQHTFPCIYKRMSNVAEMSVVLIK